MVDRRPEGQPPEIRKIIAETEIKTTSREIAGYIEGAPAGSGIRHAFYDHLALQKATLAKEEKSRENIGRDYPRNRTLPTRGPIPHDHDLPAYPKRSPEDDKLVMVEGVIIDHMGRVDDYPDAYDMLEGQIETLNENFDVLGKGRKGTVEKLKRLGKDAFSGTRRTVEEDEDPDVEETEFPRAKQVPEPQGYRPSTDYRYPVTPPALPRTPSAPIAQTPLFGRGIQPRDQVEQPKIPEVPEPPKIKNSNILIQTQTTEEIRINAAKILNERIRGKKASEMTDDRAASLIKSADFLSSLTRQQIGQGLYLPGHYMHGSRDMIQGNITYVKLSKQGETDLKTARIIEILGVSPDNRYNVACQEVIDDGRKLHVGSDISGTITREEFRIAALVSEKDKILAGFKEGSQDYFAIEAFFRVNDPFRRT